jgi:hypothetical protein
MPLDNSLRVEKSLTIKPLGEFECCTLDGAVAHLTVFVDPLILPSSRCSRKTSAFIRDVWLGLRTQREFE